MDYVGQPLVKAYKRKLKDSYAKAKLDTFRFLNAHFGQWEKYNARDPNNIDEEDSEGKAPTPNEYKWALKRSFSDKGNIVFKYEDIDEYDPKTSFPLTGLRVVLFFPWLLFWLFVIDAFAEAYVDLYVQMEEVSAEQLILGAYSQAFSTNDFFMWMVLTVLAGIFIWKMAQFIYNSSWKLASATAKLHLKVLYRVFIVIEYLLIRITIVLAVSHYKEEYSRKQSSQQPTT